MPSIQRAAGDAMLDAGSHWAGRQTVSLSYVAHAPLPSHLPLVPQLAGAVVGQAGSEMPAPTGTHRPRLVGLPHVMQLPSHALSQQTPSVQKPEAH
jgi:hypothetical protein